MKLGLGVAFLLVLAMLIPACGGGSGGTDPHAAMLEKVPLLEQIQVPGLRARVDAVRDRFGIHHIYPREVANDGAFVNGYLQARERLFQMDFLRKVAQGRLCEILGTLDSSVLSTSVFLRTVFTTTDGKRIEEKLVAELGRTAPDALALIQRYCDGVNAYLDDLDAGRNGAVLPQQYKLINTIFSLGSPYSIERWKPEHVLVLGRLQQWDLSSTLDGKLGLLERLTALGEAEARGAIPAGTAQDVERFAPADPTFVLPPEERGGFLTPAGTQASPARAATRPGKTAALVGPDRKVVRAILDSMSSVRRFDPIGRFEPGSNNWIVSGKLTATGQPLLANDPHLALGNPSTFHFVHLDDKTFAGGRINAHGAGFPGIPGILLGQNERLSWGGTVAEFDVLDVYVEQVSGSGSRKSVLFNGAEVPVLTIQEPFVVRQLTGKAKTVTVPIDIVPHHGPQVPDPDPTDSVTGLAAVGNMTLRWTGGLVTRDLLAFLGLMEARDIDGFRNALEDFAVGAQNFVGADVKGGIAYYPHALIPLREPGALTPEHPPWLPLPGTGGYEWLTGDDGSPQFVPSNRIPQSLNPERGWLVTSNNEQLGTVADNDPLNDGVYLGFDFANGMRADRIEGLLQDDLVRGPLDSTEMVDIQNDHVSLYGRRLTPRLVAALNDPAAIAGLPVPESLVIDARNRLAAWLFGCSKGLPVGGTPPSNGVIQESVACTLFHAWASHMPERLLGDEMSLAGLENPNIPKTLDVLLHLLEDTGKPGGLAVATLGPNGESRLFDDFRTPEVENANRTMALAMADAIAEARVFFGTDKIDEWRWGKAHTSTFEDLALGSILPVFNLPSASVTASRPPGYPRAGALETVDPANFYSPGLPFQPGSGPVMRHVIEMAEGATKAVNVLPGGQNDLNPTTGLFRPVKIDPAIHYGDQLPIWLDNGRRDQWIRLEDVVANAEGRILMTP